MTNPVQFHVARHCSVCKRETIHRARWSDGWVFECCGVHEEKQNEV
jgi:hypothetical protein